MSDTILTCATTVIVVLIAVTSVLAYRYHAAMTRRLDAVTHDANHDALTGLANRRLIETTLRTALATATPILSLVMIDINRFKDLNDTHGHATGDAALRHLARQLTALDPRLRLCGRLGGDEFVLIITGGSTAAMNIAHLAWRIACSHPLRVGGTTVFLQISAGIVTAVPGVGGNELLHRADLALYHAKADGPVTEYRDWMATAPLVPRPRQRIRDQHHHRVTGQPVAATPAAAKIVLRCWFALGEVRHLADHALTVPQHRRTPAEEALIQACPGALELIIDGSSAWLSSSGLPYLETADNPDTEFVVYPAATRGLLDSTGPHPGHQPPTVHHLHFEDRPLVAAIRDPALHDGYLVIDIDSAAAVHAHLSFDLGTRH